MPISIAPSDTLRADTALLRSLRQLPDYDYQHELADGQSPWAALGQWLYTHVFAHIDGWTLLYVSFAVVACLLLWVTAQRRQWLFRGQSALAGGAGRGADDIRGTDFDREIGAARRRADWPAVVRLLYLSTLRGLSDAGRIRWLPQKTPMQYVLETGSSPLRAMTQQFIRVRYGNFAATAAMADELERLRSEILRAADPAQKGGAGR